MFKFILSLLFLPACLFGASIPFSGLQPDQFGSNVSSGKVWLKTGAVFTNTVTTAGTNYGDTARTNWSWMDGRGWHNTNSSAANLGVDISTGRITAQSNLTIGTFPAFGGDSAIGLGVSNSATVRIDFKNYSTNSLGAMGLILRSDVSQILFDCYGSGVNVNGLNGLSYGGGVDDLRAITTNIFFIRTTLAAPIAFGTLNLRAMTIATNQLIGINTANPTERLTVNGNGSFSTNVWATNGFGSYSSNLLAAATITIGASPVLWTNTTAGNVNVFVDGVSVTGTVGINGGTIFNTIGQCTVPLQSGEYTTITYTIGTPTAKWKPF